MRQIEVGKRNDTDMVVLKGLKEGEIVALENPIEAAKTREEAVRSSDEEDCHSAV